jgi:hypothetical protein
MWSRWPRRRETQVDCRRESCKLVTKRRSEVRTVLEEKDMAVRKKAC